MAWTKVECRACKREFEVQLYGPMRDREWKVEHYNWLCDDCKARQREEEARKAAEQSKAMELPELVGTEKQVKWALQIRLNAIKEIEKQIEVEKAVEGIDPDGKPDQIEILMRLGFAEMLKETKASWWIDNRGMGWGVIAIQRGKKCIEEQAAKNTTQKEVK